MSKHSRSLLTVLLAAGLTASSLADVPPRPAALPAEGFTETVFGVTVEDPYRWMERPNRQAEVRTWLLAEGRHTSAILAKSPHRARFKAGLEEAFRAGARFSNHQIAGATQFYLRADPGDALFKLMRREGGREQLVLDPNAEGAGAAAINSYSVSPDGIKLAVHRAKGGSEAGEVRFYDVGKARWFGPTLSPVWGEFEITWLSDNQVAYTQMSPPDGGDPMKRMKARIARLDREGEHVAVLGHGVDPGVDFDEISFPFVEHSIGDAWALARTRAARADRRVFVAPRSQLEAGEPRWREMAAFSDRVHSTALRGDELFTINTKNSPQGELTAQHLNSGERRALPLPSGLFANGVVATRDGVYVSAGVAGASRVYFFDEGKPPAREVVLPFEARIATWRSSADGHALALELDAWTRPRVLLSAERGRVRSTGPESTPIAVAQGFRVIRETAVSADGTRVPLVVITGPGDPPKDAPTLLNAYGSYGVPSTAPVHQPALLAWVAQGGVAARCGTRGGNEFGRAWHEAGRGTNKPNAHADLIGCAERLVAMGLTMPQRLAAIGASAGGLLVPPASLQRPDLFGAMIAMVPILNPIRLEAQNNGANQFAEMGDPRTEAGFKALAAQDSTLMLSKSKGLPATLLQVGMNDRRVDPWQVAKFAADARQRFGPAAQVWVHANADTGHGFGSATQQLVEQWADIFTFAWERLAK